MIKYERLYECSDFPDNFPVPTRQATCGMFFFTLLLKTGDVGVHVDGISHVDIVGAQTWTPTWTLAALTTTYQHIGLVVVTAGCWSICHPHH